MKKIWITGGGSGIGAALAQKFRAQGHDVYISGRTYEKLEKVAHGTVPILCDVTHPQDVINAINEMPALDLVILNAGTYDPSPVLETSLEGFKETMEVNYFGIVNCLHALFHKNPHPYPSHIAITASLAGYIGLPNASGYGPSKAAVISLCESIRSEIKDQGIKFQLINPGFVKSPLTDKNTFKMPFLIEAHEAADYIVKGLSQDCFEIAFPKPFVRRLKLLQVLPYWLYFKLMENLTLK